MLFSLKIIILDRKIQSFYCSFMEETILMMKQWKPQTWVYLNCCSTSLMTVWQSRQINVPVTNSGCTGCVRTTCPLILNRVPIFWLVSSRILKDHMYTKIKFINLVWRGFFFKQQFYEDILLVSCRKICEADIKFFCRRDLSSISCKVSDSSAEIRKYSEGKVKDC